MTAAVPRARPAGGLMALVAVAVVAVDQITKWWAVDALTDGPVEIVRPSR